MVTDGNATARQTGKGAAVEKSAIMGIITLPIGDRTVALQGWGVGRRRLTAAVLIAHQTRMRKGHARQGRAVDMSQPLRLKLDLKKVGAVRAVAAYACIETKEFIEITVAVQAGIPDQTIGKRVGTEHP